MNNCVPRDKLGVGVQRRGADVFLCVGVGMDPPRPLLTQHELPVRYVEHESFTERTFPPNLIALLVLSFPR